MLPIEIKAAGGARPADAAALAAFRRCASMRVGAGLVIHAGRDVQRLDEHTVGVPFDWACR